MSLPTCPHCRVDMEEGFLLELGDGNMRKAAEWIEGKPEKSFWMGLKLDGRERIQTTTYRCPKCGLLQSYARQAKSSD